MGGMMDYEPITKGLRGRLEVAALGLPKHRADGLLAECDNIDAIHKTLEEQNAKLREKVLNQRKQLAEVQEAIERRNNGVLKRRWQKKMDALKNENEEMRNFNCRVREAILRHEDLTLWGRDYTELPLDADGEPIHVGDVMESKVGGPLFGEGSFEVRAMRCDECGWEVYDRLGERCAPSLLRHYHKPTVEDVLRELWDESHNDLLSYSPSDRDAIIMRFAKRLQLVDGDA